MGKIVIRIVGEPRVIHPFNERTVAQKFGDAARVLDVTLDAQRHGLDALQQQEGRERCQHRSGRPLIDAAAPCDIGGLAEMVCIDEPVIGRIGFVEHREALGVVFPREFPAVHDGAAERRAMPTHEFGERMNHDVGAEIDRLHQDRGRDRVIDNQRDAVLMGDVRQRFDIADVPGRVAHGFAEHRTRVVVDQLFDVGRPIARREPDGHALPRKDMRE